MKSENFMLIAVAAQRFGCRPSSLVQLRDPVLALDFDLAAAARLLQAERAALAEAREKLDEPNPASSSARHLSW